MSLSDGGLISEIRVEKLFGLYTYRLPSRGALSEATIFYGDNGVGKSTVLRMAFHLLSTAGDKGHRTELYQVQFSVFEVRLSSGVVLSARRDDPEDSDILTLSIVNSAKTLAVWPYKPRSRSKFSDEQVYDIVIAAGGERVVRKLRQSSARKRQSLPGVPFGEAAYLAALKECVPRVFILSADRRLDSDSVADPADEIELRRIMHYEDTKSVRDILVRSRAIALSQAMSNAAKWIQSRAVQGANQGSVNVHGIYGNVLEHLTKPSSPGASRTTALEIDELGKRLEKIEERTRDLARYELATPLQTTTFKDSLSVQSPSKRRIAVRVLRPYIDSLEGRLNALQSIFRLVDRFIVTLNAFLSDKAVEFKLSEGFRIRNRLGIQLDSSQLSSGEQQLLLLFCYVLTARDQPSVFMIDEPEISLNIKWQRELVQSLLNVTDQANTQFLFASHSIELLAQHRHRVVKLENSL